MGAWSERVTAIAVIGVPFGPTVDEAFDRYIDEFVEKYGPLVRAYDGDELTEKERQSAIKGRIPVWVACLQAMREWPSIAPGDIRCPTLLVVGTKNRNVMNWVRSNREALDSAGVQVEVIEGLSHQQEFSQIEQVYPLVSVFLKGQGEET
jgi:pimeloyl-ACP methyl ester carboxylesterase